MRQMWRSASRAIQKPPPPSSSTTPRPPARWNCAVGVDEGADRAGAGIDQVAFAGREAGRGRRSPCRCTGGCGRGATCSSSASQLLQQGAVAAEAGQARAHARRAAMPPARARASAAKVARTASRPARAAHLQRRQAGHRALGDDAAIGAASAQRVCVPPASMPRPSSVAMQVGLVRMHVRCGVRFQCRGGRPALTIHCSAPAPSRSRDQSGHACTLPRPATPARHGEAPLGAP